MKQKSKTGNNDIFDHIYVTLDPNQDPYKIKEEILKANEEKEKKREQLRTSQTTDLSLPIIQ